VQNTDPDADFEAFRLEKRKENHQGSGLYFALHHSNTSAQQLVEKMHATIFHERFSLVQPALSPAIAARLQPASAAGVSRCHCSLERASDADDISAFARIPFAPPPP
jgi:hypothetical protein